MSSDPIVILGARRTPVGAFQGALCEPHAHRSSARWPSGPRSPIPGVGAAEVDEVIMGCVLSAGLGQAPARQAALGAGMPAGRAHHHRQQNVRLGHARRDAGGRSDPGRFRPRDRGGRPRVDDQCALSAAQGAGRLSNGASGSSGPHVLSTGCKAPGTVSSWAALPKRPRPSTSSRAGPRTISHANRCGARRPPSRTARSRKRWRR